LRNQGDQPKSSNELLDGATLDKKEEDGKEEEEEEDRQ
jgi:hypothetical protein